MKISDIIELRDNYELKKDVEYDSLCNITTETDIKCLSFANDEKYIHMACRKKNIVSLIVPYEYRDNQELMRSGKGIVLSDNPKCLFYMIHNYFTNSLSEIYCGEIFRTTIGDNCIIHKSAIIAEKNVKIGSNVIIQENVIIREGVEIGDNVTIMSGAIIGYDACLAGKDMCGNLMPLISAGGVRIGKNVQIGSYACVSKGLFPYEITEIEDYSLVGYAVDLSHNSHIGKNTIVLDQSQVCGNTNIEDDVHVSPQCIISNRLRVGERADIAIGSVVVNNVKKGIRVAGNYAIENSKFLLWHRKKLRVK